MNYDENARGRKVSVVEINDIEPDERETEDCGVRRLAEVRPRNRRPSLVQVGRSVQQRCQPVRSWTLLILRAAYQ